MLALRIPNRLAIKSSQVLAVASWNTRQDQKSQSTLTLKTLNPLVKEVEYAVRGEVDTNFY